MVVYLRETSVLFLRRNDVRKRKIGNGDEGGQTMGTQSQREVRQAMRVQIVVQIAVLQLGRRARFGERWRRVRIQDPAAGRYVTDQLGLMGDVGVAKKNRYKLYENGQR